MPSVPGRCNSKHFKMLLKEFISASVASLEKSYSQNEARAIVFRLCEDVLGTRSYTHIVEPGFVIDKNRLPELQEKFSRLESGEPLQYVTGHMQFCGFDFKVTPDVLIPRQETELLCRHAIEFVSRISRMRQSSGKFASPVRALDLCTGSGCIAISLSLALKFPILYSSDISQAALAVAQENAKRLKSRVKFLQSDILSADTDENERFDIIVSNPPYICEEERGEMDKNVLGYEPSTALFVPDDNPLLFYKAICQYAKHALKPGGRLYLEINSRFPKETCMLLQDAGFCNVSAENDYCGRPRFVKAIKPSE